MSERKIIVYEEGDFVDCPECWNDITEEAEKAIEDCDGEVECPHCLSDFWLDEKK
jgi:uncharacterized Zn ribbon protein